MRFPLLRAFLMLREQRINLIQRQVREQSEQNGKVRVFRSQKELIEVVLPKKSIIIARTFEVLDLLIQIAFPSDLPNFWPLLFVSSGTVIP